MYKRPIINVKRPIIYGEETYYLWRRDLLSMEKRPIIYGKATYYLWKRDLLSMEKRPKMDRIIAQIPSFLLYVI